MPGFAGFRQRLKSVLTDPVAAILLALAMLSLLSRLWLLVAYRFR
jgi:hypothetical protein